jgi:hypothetical protein
MNNARDIKVEAGATAVPDTCKDSGNAASPGSTKGSCNQGEFVSGTNNNVHTSVSTAYEPSHSKSGAHSKVLLQTARVKVHGKKGVTEATVLFDTGSDRTYVSSSLVHKVGPQWVDA